MSRESYADQAYYETLLARIIYWILFACLCALAAVIPLDPSVHWIEPLGYAGFLLSVVLLVRGIVSRRAIIILEKHAVVLRGVRPGIWKLFQLWKVERIDDSEISRIRIGYIRDQCPGGLISYPPGEPSKGARFQLFLWITYGKDGRQRHIYYPHLKNVRNYQNLVKCLESRYGSRVMTHL